MKSKEELIEEMCLHYRHDYNIVRNPNDPSWTLGMTDQERKGLRKTMEALYDKIIGYYDTRGNK